MQTNTSSVNANTTKTISEIISEVGSKAGSKTGSGIALPVAPEVVAPIALPVSLPIAPLIAPDVKSEDVDPVAPDVRSETNSQLPLNSGHVFTLHLPGLKKTIPFHWPKTDPSSGNSLIVRQEFFNSICDTFGVVPRRANIYCLKNGKAEKIYSCNGRGLEQLFDGDTIILAVRGTQDESLNEYYNTQRDSLLNNKYLDPPISKDNAVFLLTNISFNFQMDMYFGHRHHFPGGTVYETRKHFSEKVQNYA
jgi:hypothetical protein